MQRSFESKIDPGRVAAISRGSRPAGPTPPVAIPMEMFFDPNGVADSERCDAAGFEQQKHALSGEGLHKSGGTPLGAATPHPRPLSRKGRGEIAWLAVVAFAALCCGCSKRAEFPSGTVVGVVTLDGQPVPRGAITFNPTGTEQGPVTGATIADGRYRCEHVPIGNLKATFALQADHLRKFVDKTGIEREVPIDILPAQYRAGLPAIVHAGENQLDFSLSSKPAR